MAQVKDPGAIAEKWARVTPGRSAEYTTGIQNPRTPWAAATRASAARYKQGVTEAANRGSFEKGVAAAGDAAWQKGAMEKGPQRFAEGVAIAQPDYAAGVAPYIDVIRSTQLPERFNRGDPRNLKRVEVIATALRKRKTG